MALLPLLAFAVLSLLSLASAQTTCNTTGLPTNAGPYVLSNATYPLSVVNAWGSYGVEWSTIAYTVAPIIAPSGTVYPTGTWVWWGTQQTVTASTDQGQTWVQLTASNDYNASSGNAQCAQRSSTNRFYVMGDELNYAQTNASYVFSSTNGYSWQSMMSAATQQQWIPRQLAFTQCVVDAQDRLYSLGQSDIWVSSDHGMTFQNITTNAFYTPRSATGTGIFTASYGDVMVLVGGLKPNYAGDLNDVWVSQTGGTVWVRQTAAAQWPARNSMNFVVNAAGVMVLHGGITGGSGPYWSDVWTSFDAGITWQALSQSSGVSRSGAAAVLDTAGFLYLFSGQNSIPTNNYFWNKDGWKSDYGINNVRSWAATATPAALTIPSTYSPCAAYYNIVAQPSAASSSSGAIAARGSSSSASASSAGCGPAGLPTNAGPYVLSNATYPLSVVNAWGSYGVEWSTIAYTVAPIIAPSGTVYPTGTWVWWGTQQTVTASTDQGQTWVQLTASNDYNASSGNAQCAQRSSTNRFYVMGDELNYAQTNASYVFSSTNGYSWQSMMSAATQQQWIPRQLAFTQCVVDAQDRLYSLGQSDIWVSSDHGMTFQNITTNAFYTPRSATGTGIFTASYGDVMVLVGGLKPNYAGDLNDVWVSQTGGTVWVRQTAAAQWPARNSMNFVVNAAGVMVLHGGITGGSGPYWSDVWTSFDAGITWQALSQSSGVSRSGAAAVLDTAGFLYLFSGQNSIPTNNYFWNKDGWKSDYALSNIQAWAGSATPSALTFPSSFSACTPYYNIVTQPPVVSSTGATTPRSSSSSAASATGSAAGCGPAGLPTSAGSYTLSNATYPAAVVNAWGSYGVEWSTIAYTVAPIIAPSGTVYPTGTWVWWGTQQTVTASTDQGQTWVQLTASNDYNASSGNAQCAQRSSTNRFYVMGDELNYAQTNASYVFSSTNGYSWQSMMSAATQQQWIPRQLAFTQCVVDAQDRLYSLGQSDIWVSSDHGMTFQNITTNAFYTPRSATGTGIFTASYGDVMVLVGGLKPNYAGDLNDVWVSQTGGTVWVRQTAAAQWPARNSMNFVVNAAGVMVLHGGITGGSGPYWSDVWTSFDAGITWQALSQSSGVSRSGAAAVLDTAGFLYLFSGQNSIPTNNYFWNKDGWKSNYAVSNIQGWTSSATPSALTFPPTFSACAPYYNILTQPPATSSSSAGARPSSSSTAAPAGTTSSPASTAGSMGVSSVTSSVYSPPVSMTSQSQPGGNGAERSVGGAMFALVAMMMGALVLLL